MPAIWKHPDLGPFTFSDEEGGWVNQVPVPAFEAFSYGRMPDKLNLVFEARDGQKTPGLDAAAMAAKAVANHKRLVSRVANALWRDFNGRGPGSGVWWHGDLGQVVETIAIMEGMEDASPAKKKKLLAGPKDILRFLSPAAIRVHGDYFGCDGSVVSLGFNAPFEEEHGVGVLTDGEVILGLGYDCDAMLFRKIDPADLADEVEIDLGLLIKKDVYAAGKRMEGCERDIPGLGCMQYHFDYESKSKREIYDGRWTLWDRSVCGQFMDGHSFQTLNIMGVPGEAPSSKSVQVVKGLEAWLADKSHQAELFRLLHAWLMEYMGIPKYRKEVERAFSPALREVEKRYSPEAQVARSAAKESLAEAMERIHAFSAALAKDKSSSDEKKAMLWPVPAPDEILTSSKCGFAVELDVFDEGLGFPVTAVLGISVSQSDCRVEIPWRDGQLLGCGARDWHGLASVAMVSKKVQKDLHAIPFLVPEAGGGWRRGEDHDRPGPYWRNNLPK